MSRKLNRAIGKRHRSRRKRKKKNNLNSGRALRPPCLTKMGTVTSKLLSLFCAATRPLGSAWRNVSERTKSLPSKWAWSATRVAASS